ncbi:ABC transporter permease [Paenarthrobacter nicotinovorans]
MIRYAGERTLRLILSLFAVSLITFGMLQLVPGTFAQLSALGATSFGSTSGQVDVDATHAGDPSAWMQYPAFMKGFLTWNIGPSYKYPQNTVESLIGDALPVSLSLAALAITVTLLLAVPIGVISALRKGRLADTGTMFILTLLQALPGYLFALLLVLVFSVWLRVLPLSGWESPANLVIPVIALAAYPTAILARYVRSSMLESLKEEYVVAAFAKGGKPGTVVVRHVLRNSLIPLVTAVGPIFASLTIGTVFVEVLLGIPGIGRLFTLAARTRDMPLLMATTLVFALILMLVNLLVDITYGFLDPRIRHAEQRSQRRRPHKKTAVSGPVSAEAIEGDRP